MTRIDTQKELRKISNASRESGSYSELLSFVKEHYKACVATFDKGERSFVIIVKDKNFKDFENMPHLANYALPNIYRLEMRGRSAVVSILKSRSGLIFADDVLESLKLGRNGGVFRPSLAGNHISLTDESTAFMRLKYNIGQVDKLP